MQQKEVRNSDSSANSKIINGRKSRALGLASISDSISISRIDININIKPHQYPFRNYQNQGEQNREPFGFDAR
jgi:hypothetical protein